MVVSVAIEGWTGGGSSYVTSTEEFKSPPSSPHRTAHNPPGGGGVPRPPALPTTPNTLPKASVATAFPQTDNGKKVQRGRPLPPRLHGEDGVRAEEEEIAGGVHEGPDGVGPVPRGQKRLLQLQAFAAEYEDANTGREAVLKYARLHAEVTRTFTTIIAAKI